MADLATGFDAHGLRHAVAPQPSPYLSREAVCGAPVRTRLSLPFAAAGACLPCQRVAGRHRKEASDGE